MAKRKDLNFEHDSTAMHVLRHRTQREETKGKEFFCSCSSLSMEGLNNLFLLYYLQNLRLFNCSDSISVFIFHKRRKEKLWQPRHSVNPQTWLVLRISRTSSLPTSTLSPPLPNHIQFQYSRFHCTFFSFCFSFYFPSCIFLLFLLFPQRLGY